MILTLYKNPSDYINFKLSLRSNLLQINYENMLGIVPPVFLLIPAIIISDDIETKNFKLLKIANFNTIGYVAGKFLSAVLLSTLLMMVYFYMIEIFLFINGYDVSSGFIIAPVIVSFAYLVPLLIPISFVFFLSSILPNKIFSVITAALLIPISYLVTLPIIGVRGTQNLSFLNQFIFSISMAYSNKFAYKIAGSSLYGINNGQPNLPLRNMIFISELSIILFLILTITSILLRKYYVNVFGMITFILEKSKSRSNK
jgi:hypothetical protein